MDDLPLWHLAVLAIVQGVTEFLPISSSAHLILVPIVAGWRDQGLAIDVAMHIGTLAAVCAYFWRDVGAMLRGTGALLRGRGGGEARLVMQLALATLPVVVAGLVLHDTIAHDWRDPVLIATTTAVFGIVLWIADRRSGVASGTVADSSWRQALLIGLAQALALVPGVSRSGITMTAALFLGFTRAEAARYSLLLSIPTTFAAGTLAAVELVRSGDAALQADAVIAGSLAFVGALAAVAALMAWLRIATFAPFVVYRLLLSAGLAVLLMVGII